MRLAVWLGLGRPLVAESPAAYSAERGRLVHPRGRRAKADDSLEAPTVACRLPLGGRFGDCARRGEPSRDQRALADRGGGGVELMPPCNFHDDDRPTAVELSPTVSRCLICPPCCAVAGRMVSRSVMRRATTVVRDLRVASTPRWSVDQPCGERHQQPAPKAGQPERCRRPSAETMEEAITTSATPARCVQCSTKPPELSDRCP